MYICVYIYVYIYIYVHIHIYIFVHTTRIYIQIYISVYLSIFPSKHAFIRTRTLTPNYIFTSCICTRTSTREVVDRYIYTYRYGHIDKCTHIYAYIHMLTLSLSHTHMYIHHLLLKGTFIREIDDIYIYTIM